MNELKVVNIKCGGCEQSIISSLEKIGLTDISVDIASQTVRFEGDAEAAKKKLGEMGYPEVHTKEAKSIVKKAKSYLSCAIGRTKK